MTTIHDRQDWHLDAALERSRPPENAFTHIALFLAWLIRHDLDDPSAFPASAATDVARVRSGAAAGSVLREAVAGALSSDVLSDEGDAFTGWYYRQYLDDYAVAFADVADYAVVDDDASYARIAPTLDRRYREWQVARDAPGESDLGGLTFSAEELEQLSDADLDTIARELADAIGGVDDAADGFPEAMGGETSHDTDGNGNPHDAPELEALLPHEVAGTPLQITSTRVSDWQSSLLRSAVENLGGDPMESFVALGIGGSGEDTLAVTLYAIPGVAQDRLEAEFSRPDYLADDQAWERRDVDGKRVWWATSDEFDTAFYAMGGLVVTAGGSPSRVRAALELLP